MENVKKDNYTKLDYESRRKIFFGPNFSKKLSELRIFIYGLKGVIKYK